MKGSASVSMCTLNIEGKKGAWVGKCAFHNYKLKVEHQLVAALDPWLLLNRTVLFPHWMLVAFLHFTYAMNMF